MGKKKQKNNEPTQATDESTSPVTEEQQAESSEAEDSQPQLSEKSEEEQLRERVAELEDRLLRSLAEFDNYKKRTARMYEQMASAANDKVLIDLLDVVDNFERALAHGDDDRSAEAFRQGIEMIYNQLTGLLHRYGVTPIEAIGQPFDANLHDALMRVKSDRYEEGTVVDEISKGYKIGDRVLRHSKVSVSMGPETETDKGTEVPVTSDEGEDEKNENE